MRFFTISSLQDAMKAFWVAFGSGAIAAYPIYRLLFALKSRQTVSQYAPEGHQAKQGTPTMGGMIVLVGIVAGILFVGPRSNLVSSYHDWTTVGAMVGLIFAFAAIGFLDDYIVPRLIKGKRGLGWKQKIVLQVFASFLAPIAMEVPPFTVLGAIIVFVVLFFSNAYNFADGLDGLAGTLGMLFFFGLAAIAMVGRHDDLPIYAAILGSFLPFLLLNAPPAKVFMGDVGSLPIGALMGLMVANVGFGPFYSISSHFSPTPLGDPFASQFDPNVLLATLGVLSLVMVAELVPVPMQIFWVKVFKRRIFPYTPIHHAFEKAGWKETKVVFVFGITQALCVAAALTVLLAFRPTESNRAWIFPSNQSHER